MAYNARVTTSERKIQIVEIEIPSDIQELMHDTSQNMGYQLEVTLIGMRFVRLTQSQAYRLIQGFGLPENYGEIR